MIAAVDNLLRVVEKQPARSDLSDRTLPGDRSNYTVFLIALKDGRPVVGQAVVVRALSDSHALWCASHGCNIARTQTFPINSLSDLQ